MFQGGVAGRPDGAVPFLTEIEAWINTDRKQI
jgi:hypothetical protein